MKSNRKSETTIDETSKRQKSPKDNGIVDFLLVSSPKCAKLKMLKSKTQELDTAFHIETNSQ